MKKKINKEINFRIGDVVARKDGKDGLYVVCGTKGWLHKPFIHDKKDEKMIGEKDKWISLAKEIGATSLLTHESEYKLVMLREKVGKNWWKIFPKGEK